MKPLPRLLLGLLTWAGANGDALGAAAALPDAPRVFRLPAFEVNALRPWLYARLPGYEILSLRNRAETLELVEELQRAARFAPLFLPPGTRTDATVPSTLFISHHAGESAIAEVDRRTQHASKVAGLYLIDKGRQVQLPGEEIVAGWRGDSYSPLILHLNGVLNVGNPTAPYWFRDGYLHRLQPATISGPALELPGFAWTRAMLMPVSDLLAVASAGESMAITQGPEAAADAPWTRSLGPEQRKTYFLNLSDTRNRYLNTARLFFDWGFFADNGERRAGFLALAAAAAAGPVDEAVFRRHLGLGFEEANRQLAAYGAKDSGSRQVRLLLHPELAARAAEPVEVRPATLAEVSRLVGGFYLALGRTQILAENRHEYRGLARELLYDAHRQGEVGAELLTELAFLEFDDGNAPLARRHLEAALAGGSRRPYAYALEGLLRLQAAGYNLGDASPLPADVAERVLAPLREAWSLRPRVDDAYWLLADVRLRGAGRLPAEELAILAEVPRDFPDDLPLRLAVARLFARSDRVAEARRMTQAILAQPDLKVTLQADARALLAQLGSGEGTP